MATVLAMETIPASPFPVLPAMLVGKALTAKLVLVALNLWLSNNNRSVTILILMCCTIRYMPLPALQTDGPGQTMYRSLRGRLSRRQIWPPVNESSARVHLHYLRCSLLYFDHCCVESLSIRSARLMTTFCVTVVKAVSAPVYL